MTLDLLAFAILALFAALGAWRGGLASGLSLAGLLLAYGAALAGSYFLGVRAADRLELPVLVAAPIAGAASGLLAYILFSAFGSALRRRERERLGDESRPSIDRLLGGLFGGVRGLLLVFLVSYLGNWIDAALKTRPEARSADASAGLTDDSVAARIAGGLVENALEAASGDLPAGRVLARVAGRPSESLVSLQALTSNDSLRGLQADTFFWTLVANGAADRAANQLSFQRLIHDEDVRREFANLGFVDEIRSADPRAMREELVPILERLAPRLKKLRDDPQIRALAEDPEIASYLKDGNTLALIAHPEVRRIAKQFAAEDP